MVNIMSADALIPYVARSSAAMILAVLERVLREDKLQKPPSQCQGEVLNSMYIYVSLKTALHVMS